MALKEIWAPRGRVWGLGSPKPWVHAAAIWSRLPAGPSGRLIFLEYFSVAFSPLEFGFGLAIGVLVDLLGRKLVESKKRRLLQLNVQWLPSPTQLFTSPALNMPHLCSQTVREPETAHAHPRTGRLVGFPYSGTRAHLTLSCTKVTFGAHWTHSPLINIPGIVVVQSLSHVPLFVTLWPVAHQAPLASTISPVCSNSCPLSRWCHPTISSSVIPFSSCPSNFPSIRVFPRVSSLHQVAKVLELQLQHQSFQWIFKIDFLSDWLVWSCCPRDSQRIFSSTTIWKHQFWYSAFFMVQLSHPYTTTGNYLLLIAKSYPTLLIPMTVTTRLLCPWNSPGNNTGVACHSLLQGIFPT